MLERATVRSSDVTWQCQLGTYVCGYSRRAHFLAFTLCCAHHAAVLLQVMQAWGVLALSWGQLLLMALPCLLSTERARLPRTLLILCCPSPIKV